ncbi:hydroxyisourate hydrolase [Agromyces sp. H3Y2-19a]|uniref:hydroxyisourate hydrolase n=1 Tax=Agromyces TaxID=33877 RepID=UPI001E349D1F|nr:MULTISPECIES: hydroxyisourate hydrolase [Agromyces]MCD5347968.1 hydroxyisourate hydrolase [Agromyces sp. S2-1-8]MDF0514439.1 hydroxyisourate hydrolase [Agromyces chromiiresistens]
MTVSQITTHVLDAQRGRPAAGVPVELYRRSVGGSGASGSASSGDGWELLASAVTDDDGRAKQLGPETIPNGEYRLRFDTGAYFASTQTDAFYPEVLLTFLVAEEGRHYHVPILLSPFAYSTYRGS